MTNTTYSFFKRFSKDNFCLIYDGNIVEDLTFKIISLSECHYKHQKGYATLKKKVTFLLAECFQNIVRHRGKAQTENNKNIDFGFFLTRSQNGIYFITSGNLIKKEKVKDLKAHLNKINKLDQESLKALYLDVLVNNDFSKKGGAGLGLIEIARKSDQKIEYIFNKFDNNFSIFYSQVMLNPHKQIIEDKGYHIDEAMQCHREILSKNIILMQKGDFSNNSLTPVLEILQKNLPDIFMQSHPRKEVYHVLVEVLQNLSRNGTGQNGRKEGIFMIKKKENSFVISAGIYVVKSQKIIMSKQIDFLNGLSKMELKSRYLKSLNEENQGAQIEMIDIARRSTEAIKYNFIQETHEECFFSISVAV
jgi:hypothetical protein